MPSTTRYRRGDVLLVLYPFTDLSTSKKRPGVVVSGSWVLEKRGHYVISPITSNVHGEAGHDEVRIRGAEITMSGLVAESLVKTSMLFSLDPCLVTRRLGRLPGGVMAQVDSGVHSALREDDAS
jgi:mRNA interferase MazF